MRDHVSAKVHAARLLLVGKSMVQTCRQTTVAAKKVVQSAVQTLQNVDWEHEAVAFQQQVTLWRQTFHDTLEFATTKERDVPVKNLRHILVLPLDVHDPVGSSFSIAPLEDEPDENDPEDEIIFKVVNVDTDENETSCMGMGVGDSESQSESQSQSNSTPAQEGHTTDNNSSQTADNPVGVVMHEDEQTPLQKLRPELQKLKNHLSVRQRDLQRELNAHRKEWQRELNAQRKELQRNLDVQRKEWQRKLNTHRKEWQRQVHAKLWLVARKTPALIQAGQERTVSFWVHQTFQIYQQVDQFVTRVLPPKEADFKIAPNHLSVLLSLPLHVQDIPGSLVALNSAFTIEDYDTIRFIKDEELVFTNSDCQNLDLDNCTQPDNLWTERNQIDLLAAAFQQPANVTGTSPTVAPASVVVVVPNTKYDMGRAAERTCTIIVITVLLYRIWSLTRRPASDHSTPPKHNQPPVVTTVTRSDDITATKLNNGLKKNDESGCPETPDTIHTAASSSSSSVLSPSPERQHHHHDEAPANGNGNDNGIHTSHDHDEELLLLLQHKQDECQKLYEQLKAVKEELQRRELEQPKLKSNDDYEQQQAHLTKLRQLNSELQQLAEGKDLQLLNFSTQVQQLTQDLSARESQLSNLLNMYSDLKVDLEKMEARSVESQKRAREQHHVKVQEMEALLVESRISCEQLSAKLRDAALELEQRKETQTNLEKEVAQQVARSHSLEVELQQGVIRSAELEAKLHKVQTKSKELETELERVTALSKKLEEQLEHEQNKPSAVPILENGTTDKTATIADAMAANKVNMLTSNLQHLNEEHERLKLKLQDQFDQNALLQKQVEHQKRLYAKQQERNRILLETNQSLNGLMDEKQRQCNELASKVANFAQNTSKLEELRKLRQEKENRTQQLLSSQTRHAQEEMTSMSNVKSELNEKEQKIQHLESEIVRVQNDCAQQMEEIQRQHQEQTIEQEQNFRSVQEDLLQRIKTKEDECHDLSLQVKELLESSASIFQAMVVQPEQSSKVEKEEESPELGSAMGSEPTKEADEHDNDGEGKKEVFKAKDDNKVEQVVPLPLEIAPDLNELLSSEVSFLFGLSS